MVQQMKYIQEILLECWIIGMIQAITLWTRRLNRLKENVNNSKNNHFVQLFAVSDGEIIDIEKVKDSVFSQKMIGDGYAINPTSSTIIAPIQGEVIEVAETKHAYYIETIEGLKVLIHIGENTLLLNGQGLTSFVKKGDQLQVGDELGTVDLDFLKQEGYESTISVIFLYNDSFNLDITPYLTQHAVSAYTIACDCEIEPKE